MVRCTRRLCLPLPPSFLALLVLLGTACASAARPPEWDPFRIEGAADILRATTPAAAAEVREAARFLHDRYGYVPDGSFRDLRDLRDLLDREARFEPLTREPTLSLGREIVARFGYRFRPADAARLASAAAGPPAALLRDARVRRFLEVLRPGLLGAGAGRDFLALDDRDAAALSRLAADPEIRARIEGLARAIGYRFVPTDAPALLSPDLGWLDGEAAGFLSEILAVLRVEPRARYLPELRVLASHPGTVRDLLSLARRAEVSLSGPGAVIVLARLCRRPRPLAPDARDRLVALARRTVFPDAGDFLFLVPLSRDPGVLEVVEKLSRRYRYRFRPSQSAGLLALVRRGIPPARRPAWAVTDRVPLVRPGLLLSPEPARAFVDSNDLRFMEALERARPDLASMPRSRLERIVRRRIRGRPVRYRLGAPYAETAGDLSRFLRPDLLKALLLLDALDRPETLERIAAWMEEDLRDPATERGGYVRLDARGSLRFEKYSGTAGTGGNDHLALPPDPEGAALDFHFHATDEDDSAYAGPSSGSPGTDLFRAARLGMDGVVFTRLRGGRIDTDLYTSGKCVLDLGVR